jgi:hypothetical protein
MVIFLIANTAIIVSKKEFKLIKVRYGSMVIYFFFIALMTVISFACWLFARKWTVVSELAIPAYGVIITLILLPAWYEDYSDPLKPKKIIADATLTTIGVLYLFNIALGFFFTSHYALGTAMRSLMTVNNLNILLKRVVLKQVTLPPALFNWLLTHIIFELHSYYYNREKVKLFLEKERCRQQEKQTSEII